MSLSRFKLVFFSPRANTKEILHQLFTKFPNELGKIGEYDRCAFVCPGTGQSSLDRTTVLCQHTAVYAGQFRPGPGANPTIGAHGQVEYVEEDRVEIVVNDKGQNRELKDAVEELKKVLLPWRAVSL